jgi:FkbM family methyltransferase
MLKRHIGSAYSTVLRSLRLEPQLNLHPETNGEYALLRRLPSLPEIAQYDCVVDIGAHRGEWTVEAMKAFSGSSIRKFVCVEPVPHLAQALRQSFAGVDEVQIIEAAVSDSTSQSFTMYDVGGTGRIYPSYRTAQSAGLTHVGSKPVRNIQVRAIAGDELFRDLRPYVIKIDCEGHDFRVLDGLTSVIKENRPLLQFEYSEFWIAAESRLSEAVRLLSGLNYNLYRLFPDHLSQFRLSGFIDTFKYQNIVAAPAEWKSLGRKSEALS